MPESTQSSHEASCKTLERRIFLSRAAMLLKETMLQYRMNAFSLNAILDENRESTEDDIYLRGGAVDGKECFLAPFPSVIPDQNTREAVLLMFSCDLSQVVLDELANALFDDYTTIDRFDHCFYKVAVGEGELREAWAMDVTGAQFGYPGLLILWSVYEKNRVHSQMTKETFRLGSGWLLWSGCIDTKAIAYQKVQYNVAKDMGALIPAWKAKFAEDLSGMLKGSEKPFQEGKEKFLGQVGEAVKNAVELLYSGESKA